MTMTALIREINKLPVEERELLIESTIQSIKHEKAQHLENAVNELYAEYKTNKDLTSFTSLDAESFYEAR